MGLEGRGGPALNNVQAWRMMDVKGLLLVELLHALLRLFSRRRLWELVCHHWSRVGSVVICRSNTFLLGFIGRFGSLGQLILDALVVVSWNQRHVDLRRAD